jgi:hypothetical protein
VTDSVSETLVFPPLNKLIRLVARKYYIKQQEVLYYFLEEELGSFGKCGRRKNVVEHVVDTAEASSIKQRYYPVTPVVQEAINAQVGEMLKEGVIEPSNSPWSSHIVLVKKPNGRFRFCLDFLELYKFTKRNSAKPSTLVQLI